MPHGARRPAGRRTPADFPYDAAHGIERRVAAAHVIHHLKRGWRLEQTADIAVDFTGVLQRSDDACAGIEGGVAGIGVCDRACNRIRREHVAGGADRLAGIHALVTSRGSSRPFIRLVSPWSAVTDHDRQGDESQNERNRSRLRGQDRPRFLATLMSRTRAVQQKIPIAIQPGSSPALGSWPRREIAFGPSRAVGPSTRCARRRCVKCLWQGPDSAPGRHDQETLCRKI